MWMQNSGPGPTAPDDPVEGESETTPLRKKILEVYWDNGLQFVSLGGKFKMKMGGELQLDGGFFHLDDTLQEEFGDLTHNGRVRRARIYLHGAVGKKITFNTAWDFTGSDGSVIKNNYIQIQGVPVVQTVRIGYMQEPFSLNEVTSNQYLAFMERSLADTLAPRKNVGILFTATPKNNLFTVTVGLFYDTDNFGNPKGDAQSFTSRSTILPVYKNGGEKIVQVGFSYSYRNQIDNTASFSQQPESYLLPNFVNTGVFPADFLNDFGLEAVYKQGNWTFESEYIQSRAINSGTSNMDPTFQGYYVQGIYSFGKHRVFNASNGSFYLSVPSDFNLGDSNRLQLTGRISEIDLSDKNVQGGVLRDVTLGLNWLLSRNMLLEFNYIHARLKTIDSVGFSSTIQMRFQYYL